MTFLSEFFLLIKYSFSSIKPIPKSATCERNEEANPSKKQVTKASSLKLNCDRQVKKPTNNPAQKPRH